MREEGRKRKKGEEKKTVLKSQLSRLAYLALLSIVKMFDKVSTDKT